MPIRYETEARAVFTGICTPEEADGFLEWLRATPAPAIDLAACTLLHTALAQLIMAARPRVLAPLPDVLMATCLGLSPTPPASARKRRPARRNARSNADLEVTP